MDAEFPRDSAIGKWPVVARFGFGMILRSAQGNMGNIILEDAKKDPWLMVTNGAGRVAFVRANRKYIYPVNVTPRGGSMNSQGDWSSFERTALVHYWEVVAQEPVKGRISKDIPADWSNARMPRKPTPTSWAAGKQFQRGEILRGANNRTYGTTLVYDSSNPERCWVLVEYETGKVCLVPTSGQCIKPVDCKKCLAGDLEIGSD